MQQKLDQILLSNKPVENFYASYENEKFRNWILAILPEIDKCKNQKQNNPWHIFDCLEHILHSVSEMNKLTKNLPHEKRKMLAYTMLLHDIGKPVSHIKREKNGQIIDSFFGHNLASEKIARRALPQLGFNKTQTEIISKLVEAHDIFMFITLDKNNTNPYHHILTDEYLQQEINNLSAVGNGKKLMSDLILVGKADNLAQNPAMTQESLQKLDIIKQMLDTTTKPQHPTPKK